MQYIETTWDHPPANPKNKHHPAQKTAKTIFADYRRAVNIDSFLYLMRREADPS
jgi:hypothetical protein